METLLHQVGLLSPPRITQRAYPWTRSSSCLIHHTSLLHERSSTRRATELQAQGRGFGAVSVPDKKARAPEEDDSAYRSAGNSSGEGDDEITQLVFDRMLRRVLISVGGLIGSGIGLLYFEAFLKKNQIWEVPAWLPLLTILLSFGMSAFGIAYGTLSTSWDPNKEGSLLGWEQAQKNWPRLWKEE